MYLESIEVLSQNFQIPLMRMYLLDDTRFVSGVRVKVHSTAGSILWNNLENT